MDYMPVTLLLYTALMALFFAVVWLFVPFAIFRQTRVQKALLAELQALRRELAARKEP